MAIQFDNTNTSSVTLRPGTAADAIILNGLGHTASGDSSAIVGGLNNLANNFYSVVVGGSSGSATGVRSIVLGGSGNNASANSSVIVGGQSNNSIGFTSAVISGSGNTASGQSSMVAGGESSTANGTFSSVVGGRYGTTRSIVGNFVSPASDGPIASSSGRQQLATLLLGRQTTDATATVLRSDPNAASTTNQVILPNNSAYFFQGQVVAGVTGAGDTKGWTVEGVIKRGANAASTVLVGSTVMSSYGDAGAATWLVAVTADTTNGGLAVTVTGAAATTIRWVAQIRTTEMTY
jgi:hypothetical protein